MDISQYPAINFNDLDASQDLIVISNEDNPDGASATLESLLDSATVKKEPYYHVEALHLDIESRKSRISFSSGFEKDGLLAQDSQFVAHIDFFVNFKKDFVSENDGPFYDRKTVMLPSLSMHKNFGEETITISNYQENFTFGNVMSDTLPMSTIHYNNNDYILQCYLRTLEDSISFDHISYSRNQLFDTRINFSFESYI